LRAGTISVGSQRDIAAALGLQVLRLDDRGRRAAEQHREQGANGAAVMAIPLGIPPWLEAAFAQRERQQRSKR
jgi:hypothetical protein